MTKKDPPRLKKRQRDILMALKGLGGNATLRAIAERVGMHEHDVSQSLSVLAGHGVIRPGSYKAVGGGDSVWEIIPPSL